MWKAFIYFREILAIILFYDFGACPLCEQSKKSETERSVNQENNVE